MEYSFSVIIPCFNRADQIGRAIRSVLNQELSDWELIIVDDGSSDTTQSIVESFKNLTYVYQNNAGVSAARNHGAKLASGDWLIFLDSDDELYSNSLFNFQNAIRENPDSTLIRARVEQVESSKSQSPISTSWSFLAGSFCIKRDLFEQLGGYDERLKFAENTELLFRIQRLGIQTVQTDFVSSMYHLQTNSGASNLNNMTESIELILSKHDQFLSNRVKYLYHQILGVNYIRFRKFHESRKNFRSAIGYHLNIGTFVRYSIAWIPPVARFLYSPNPEVR